MVVLAVREVLAEAINRAREWKRPSIVEAKTYRYRGHSMSDPGKYRTKDEVEHMMRHDPIAQFGRWLIEHERFSQADLDAVDREVRARVEEATAFADESPVPTPGSLYEDLYVRSPYINMTAAERDPAWKASVEGDRMPEERPAPDLVEA
jgi:pyruvate dehydrogenase E1 component alpha subunit